MENKIHFSPSICVTHNCNLNCIYCYQKHDKNSKMTFNTAKKVIDWIFQNVPENRCGIEINIIGGEPLLEFELIKQMVDYTKSINPKEPYLYYATTNGTLLTEDLKTWFVKNREYFWLGISLDGDRETHNHNRSNSFDRIDLDFFRNNWKGQSVKMTLSDYSLRNLAHDIKFIHSLGFPIRGVNEFEGDFNWDKDEYINIACEIAKQSGVIMDRNDLALKAEEFALSSGSGRSPRTAKQFVHHLLNELIH